MERADAVALLVFCVGVSYAAGWTAAVVASGSGRHMAGFRGWVWAAGLVAAAVAVFGAAVAAWF